MWYRLHGGSLPRSRFTRCELGELPSLCAQGLKGRTRNFRRGGLAQPRIESIVTPARARSLPWQFSLGRVFRSRPNMWPASACLCLSWDATSFCEHAQGGDANTSIVQSNTVGRHRASPGRGNTFILRHECHLTVTAEADHWDEPSPGWR